MEVGKNVYYTVNHLCHMVLALKPFGCMPSTQSDGVQSRVVNKFKDMIFLPIETSGEGEVNAHSRVQMALAEAKAKARAEFDEFLQIRGHIDLGEDHHRAARGSHLLLRRASGAARTGLQLALGVGRFPGAPGPTTTLARRRRLARGESAAITLASYAAAVAVLLTGSRTVRSPKSATRSRRPPRAST